MGCSEGAVHIGLEFGRGHRDSVHDLFFTKSFEQSLEFGDTIAVVLRYFLCFFVNRNDQFQFDLFIALALGALSFSYLNNDANQ